MKCRAKSFFFPGPYFVGVPFSRSISVHSNFHLGALVASIKVAVSRERKNCIVPFSKLNCQVIRFLYLKGFIGEYRYCYSGGQVYVELDMIYHVDSTSPLLFFKLVSVPSRRCYLPVDELFRLFVFNRRGRLTVICTSQGLMYVAEAVTRRLGGSVLFHLS